MLTIDNVTNRVQISQITSKSRHYVSIGTNIHNENAKGKMYEVICFNKALSNNDIDTITDILKIYYPFI